MDTSFLCATFGLVLALVLVIGVVRAILNRSSSVKPDLTQDSAPPPPSRYLSDNSGSPNRGKAAVWFGPGSIVIIQGREIRDGLFYLGESLPDPAGYENDACLINQKLKVTFSESPSESGGLPYWPRFARLSPLERGVYLRWLINGRSDTGIEIGFVFLYFYGLERRLIFDGRENVLSVSERAAIKNEIFRLLGIYGNNRSFRNYAANLLAAEWIINQKGEAIPEYINLSNGNLLGPFQIKLAEDVANGRPISAATAFQWLCLRPDFYFRTPARRCENEFRKLFAQLYRQKFGDGMIVRPNKTPLVIEYQAASPSLQVGIKFASQGSPSPFNLSSPVKKLIELAEVCTNQLDAYSRHLARPTSDPNALFAVSLLPPILIPESPLGHKVREVLGTLCPQGPATASLFDIYEQLGQKSPANWGRKEIDSITSILDAMGYGIAPDVRYHNIKAGKDGVVTIFPQGNGTDFKPSVEFLSVNTILLLGASVSSADSDVSHSERALLQALIDDNRKLTQPEKSSLSALRHWCMSAPPGRPSMKPRIASISKDERWEIGKLMISVAHSDGRVDPKEIKALEKIYRLLELPPDRVLTDIHEFAATNEPITVSLGDEIATYSIPRESTGDATTFILNQKIIDMRQAETEQVKNLLEEIFVEAEPEIPAVPVVSEVHESKGNLETLDRLHRALFLRLTTNETWTRTEFETICSELGLMPDGAIEGINEWSFKSVNAALIEDGEPVYVDMELAEELTNG